MKRYSDVRLSSDERYEQMLEAMKEAQRAAREQREAEDEDRKEEMKEMMGADEVAVDEEAVTVEE